VNSKLHHFEKILDHDRHTDTIQHFTANIALMHSIARVKTYLRECHTVWWRHGSCMYSANGCI